jgi:hypothetical protein
MIQITPQMRVLVAIERVDGRKGLDSLMRLCQESPLAELGGLLPPTILLARGPTRPSERTPTFSATVD